MNKALYRLFYTVVICLFFVLCFASELSVGEMSFVKVLLVIIVAAYLSSISMMSTPIKLTMIAFPAAATLGIWLVGGDRFKEWVAGYIETCFMGHSSLEELPVSFSIVQIILIAVLSCFVAILFEKLAGAKYAGGIALAGYLIYQLISETEMDRYGVAMAVAFIMTVLLEIIQKNWKKQCQSDIEKYVVYLMPAILVYMVIIMMMPHSEKPYDWHYTKQMYERVTKQLERIQFNFGKSNVENYTSSMAGFSDANSFFGQVSDEGKIIMTVDGDSSLVTNLYLTGRIYDSFYGKGWEQVRQETEKDMMTDAMELVYAVKLYDNAHYKDYVSRTKVNVQFGDYHTRHTFLPLKAHMYYWGDGNRNNLYSAENLFAGQRWGYGDTYSFDFYQMNMNGEAFDAMLEQKLPADEALWKQVWGGYKIYSFSMEDKRAYESGIIKDYSQDIALSPDMQQWVDDVCSGAETDIERLRRIEQALGQFEYNINPDEVPEEVDTAEEFLDYFVLDSQKGYCTFYATAFTLLARSLGLPSRYVEGFCVPSSQGITNVTGNMCHAWPEVFIDGYGWIPFEPTPGYGALRYTSWDVGNDTAVSNEEAREWYLQMQAEMEEKRQQEENGETEPEETGKKMSVEDRIFVLRLIAIILVSLDLMILVVDLIARWYYNRLSLAGKYQYKVNDSLRVLAFMGIRRGSSETLLEFAKRVDEALLNHRAETVTFLANYEYVIYGQYEVTEQWLEEVSRDNRMLKDNFLKYITKGRKEPQIMIETENVV